MAWVDHINVVVALLIPGLSLANTDTSKGPRGIRGFALENNTFSEWKVQGKIGGYKKYVSSASSLNKKFLTPHLATLIRFAEF